MASSFNPKYSSLDNLSPRKLFDFIYLMDRYTIRYLNQHGRVAFVIRGPPGTAKDLLRDMLLEVYTSCDVLSASDYFDLKLANIKNKSTLADSHEWCKERLKELCHKNSTCIILKNSHITRREVENYLDILNSYNYTVIMSETPRKLKTDPKILEETNLQGLNENYFINRLRSWDDMVPWFTGWFLNPADSQWIFEKSQSVLLSLYDREDFQKIYSGKVTDKFIQEKVIFCIAAYCGAGKIDEGREFYLNPQIQEVYGKIFELFITAFVIYKNMLIAVVELTPEEYEMTYYKNATTFSQKLSQDSLERSIRNMKILDDSDEHKRVKNIDNIKSKKTFEIVEKKVHNYGLMLLGWNEKKRTSLISEFENSVNLKFIMEALRELAKFEEAGVNEIKTYKIKEVVIIQIDRGFRCKSVFTGLY